MCRRRDAVEGEGNDLGEMAVYVGTAKTITRLMRHYIAFSPSVELA